MDRDSIYDIVGHRQLPEGWLPDYRPIGHRRSMLGTVIVGWTLIALGASLMLAIWARWRSGGR